LGFITRGNDPAGTYSAFSGTPASKREEKNAFRELGRLETHKDRYGQFAEMNERWLKFVK